MLPRAFFSVCVARISSKIGVNVPHLLIYRFSWKKFSECTPTSFMGQSPMLPRAFFSVCVARISSKIDVNVHHLLIYQFGRKKIFGVHPNDFYQSIPYIAQGLFLGLCCSDFFQNWCQCTSPINLSIWPKKNFRGAPQRFLWGNPLCCPGPFSRSVLLGFLPKLVSIYLTY